MSFSVFQLKIIYAPVTFPGDVVLKAGFTVGMRHFPKAVHRNRIKRLMRETFRLEKKELIQALAICDQQIALFFIFTGKTIPKYNEIHNAMQLALATLMEKIKDKSTAKK